MIADILTTFVHVMHELGRAPDPHSKHPANEMARHIFSASERPLIAALLTLAVVIREARNERA